METNLSSQSTTKTSIYRRLCGGATPETQKKPFGMLDLSAYAAGDFACNMSFFLNSQLLLFWTQYMGLPAYVWSIVIIVLKVWDAINDPIIGALMDGRKQKIGMSKFKPWIFYGSFALLFAGALCFLPIKDSPMWLKIIVLFVGYLSWDTAYTIVNVPYGSMNSVISAVGYEKAQLSTWRTLGSTIAQIATTIIIPFIVFDNATGVFRGQYLFVIALVCGGIGLLGFMYFLWGTTERVIVDYDKERKGEKINYLKVVKNFFKNKPAVIMTIASMIQLLVAMGFLSLSTSLIFQQLFPAYSNILGFISLTSIIPTIALVPLVKKLVIKFGKKELAVFTLPLTVVGAVLMCVMPFGAWSDLGGQYVIIGISVLTICNLLIGFGSAFLNLLTWSMVADCIDYQEMKSGERNEGIVYAIYSLGRKLAQGIAASLPVLILSAITGYEGFSNPILEKPDVGYKIVYVLAGSTIVSYVLVFVVLLFFYGLDKKSVLNMEKTLNRSNIDLIGESGEED